MPLVRPDLRGGSYCKTLPHMTNVAEQYLFLAPLVACRQIVAIDYATCTYLHTTQKPPFTQSELRTRPCSQDRMPHII